MDEGAWWATVHAVAESDTTVTKHKPKELPRFTFKQLRVVEGREMEC